MTRERKMQFFAWGSSALVVVLAVIAWGETYAWRLSRMTVYQVFPLLGLSAFSLMWSHYIASVTRQYFELDRAVLRQYFEMTSAAVLVLILLHPGLLAWQLWLDGAGLPPGSELNYVMPSARWAVLFGFTALGIFLAYEFRRAYEKTSWWKFVQYASDAAMVLIFFHALKLGGALQLEWFRAIWYLYGLTFLVALGYGYYKKGQARLQK